MAGSSPLEALGRPLFFPVRADLDAPTPALETAQRTRVRQLGGMQKEALVTEAASGTTWRLASDEGDYLDGDDVAPCPLAVMTTGMTASYVDAVRREAAGRDVSLDGLRLVQDSRYTMTGSALRGDMTGGALDPQLAFEVDADAADATLEGIVEDAVAAAPATGLLAGTLANGFSLALAGEPLEPDRVPALSGPRPPDPADEFASIPRDADVRDRPLARHTGRLTEPFEGDRSRYTSGSSSSLEAEQDRVLHLRGTAELGPDGTTAVEVKLYSPRGSVFELRSAPAGDGRAPPPTTYLAAGIGFCFMTQLGRYADILGSDLADHAVVQDTGFGSAPGRAEPVETHVFLESTEGPAFARDALDMAEQTCFLHALCRTDLEPSVSVAGG